MDHSINSKILSAGLGSWIQFERACKRTEVFSESYLSNPISQILNSHTNHRVVSEFRHPVLSSVTTGAGRRPTTDYVICDHDENVFLAIESKWVGRSSPTPRDILWDLIRLELIRHKFDASCYFILGGQKKKLTRLSESQGFIDKKRKGWRKTLLRFDSNSQNTVKLDSTDVFRRPMLKEIYKNRQSVEFPVSLATCRGTPFPKESTNQDFVVFVWELVGKKAQLMKPKNNRHFHINSVDL